MGEDLPISISERDLRQLISLRYPSQVEQTFKYLAGKRQLRLRDLIKKRARVNLGKEVREQTRYVYWFKYLNFAILFIQ